MGVGCPDVATLGRFVVGDKLIGVSWSTDDVSEKVLDRLMGLRVAARGGGGGDGGDGRFELENEGNAGI